MSTLPDIAGLSGPDYLSTWSQPTTEMLRMLADQPEAEPRSAAGDAHLVTSREVSTGAQWLGVGPLSPTEHSTLNTAMLYVFTSAKWCA